MIDTIVSLFLLVLLAVMAHQSRKVVLPAVLFGGLKATASCYYLLAEASYEVAILVAATQFVVNTLLGLGIAYLVAKHSEEKKYVYVTTCLAMMTFLTAIIDRAILA